MRRKFLKSDLHVHTRFSDGSHSVSEVVDIYGQRGFDTIAITDHLAENKNVIGQFTHRMKYSLDRSTFDVYLKEVKKEALRAREQYNMNVLFGFEITKNYFSYDRSCHILILGVEEYISPELEPEEILLQAKEKGGIIIAAHPFHTGKFEFQTFYLWSRREKLKSFFDAWEVTYRKNVSPEVLRSGLPLVATSDFHHLEHLNSWKTKLYCENDFRSIQSCLRNREVDFYLHSENNWPSHLSVESV